MNQRFRNVLLKSATDDCLAAIEPHVERVELKELEIISQPGKPAEYVYFVEQGVLSVISHLDEGRDVELGIIGKEGMSGEAICLGDDRSPFAVVVEMPGSAWRLPADRFRLAIQQSRELHAFLLRYVRAQYLQISSTAAASQRGSVEERLARWLLMGFDRIDGDRFHVSHNTLSWLVGARRSGITDALHCLESRGVIRSTRNTLIIRNPEGLVDVAGSIYGLAEREYARLLGTDFRKHNNRGAGHVIPQLFSATHSPRDVG